MKALHVLVLLYCAVRLLVVPYNTGCGLQLRAEGVLVV